jgi:transposase-like protein
MERSGTPGCPRCGDGHTVRNGTVRGRQRWLCRACRRTFGPTTGTPLAGLHTDLAEVARALLAVLRRGSLRAAEEQTGHKDETIGAWLRRAGEHAERLTAVLVEELPLSDVAVDEFWSFVRKKGARGRTRASAGAA